ncbi:MAG TPA: hypothetical protein VHB18_00265 [Mycobacteriales bacterium]|jgi:hypothetical protein|nr:hypothetical protein [Mycobacteriales bacterium]
MGVLAWLGVPAIATLLAIVWVNWSARPRGPVETEQSLAERERFKAAFDRQSLSLDVGEAIAADRAGAERTTRRAS